MEKDSVGEQRYEAYSQARDALVYAVMAVTAHDVARNGAEARETFVEGVITEGQWPLLEKEVGRDIAITLEATLTPESRFMALLYTAPHDLLLEFVATQEPEVREQSLGLIFACFRNTRESEEYKDLVDAVLGADSDNARTEFSIAASSYAIGHEWSRIDALLDRPLLSRFLIDAAGDAAESGDLARFVQYMDVSMQNIREDELVEEECVAEAILQASAVAESDGHYQQLVQYLEHIRIDRLISAKQLERALYRGKLKALVDLGKYEAAAVGIIEEMAQSGMLVDPFLASGIQERNWDMLLQHPHVLEDGDLRVAIASLAYEEDQKEVFEGLCAIDWHPYTFLDLQIQPQRILSRALERDDWIIVAKAVKGLASPNAHQGLAAVEAVAAEAFERLCSGDEQRIAQTITDIVCFLDQLEDINMQSDVFQGLYEKLLLRGEDAIVEALSERVEITQDTATNLNLPGYIAENSMASKNTIDEEAGMAAYRGEWKRAIQLAEIYGQQEEASSYYFGRILFVVARQALSTLQQFPASVKHSPRLL